VYELLQTFVSFWVPYLWSRCLTYQPVIARFLGHPKKWNLIALYGNVSYCLGAFAEFWKATISFVLPVRPYGTTRLPLAGRIFVTFGIWGFFENPTRKFKSVTLTKRFAGFAWIHYGVDEEFRRIDLRENRFSNSHVVLQDANEFLPPPLRWPIFLGRIWVKFSRECLWAVGSFVEIVAELARLYLMA